MVKERRQIHRFLFHLVEDIEDKDRDLIFLCPLLFDKLA